MTPSSAMQAVAPLLADLASDLPAPLRYERLLHTLRQLVPCDAVALLRLEGSVLTPVAVLGLSPDTLGRRFEVAAHPRLQQLLAHQEALLFPSDCELPDPYDGLVAGDHLQLEVHDCMGCALRVGDATWGLLTLDSLSAGQFSSAHLRLLGLFASLAAATVVVAERLQRLSNSVADERRRAEAFRLARPAQRELIGNSPAMQQLQREIELVAPSELTVLVAGETGVGKELTVQRLHNLSSRADKPLVIVNCAALPEHLVESELFGHVRGAFSGAVGDRQGKFAMAHGGTLFLDEVGELPLAVQAKLLRALQDGQLQRVGSDRELHVDVRLIAATNRDLGAEVKAGRFRADLFHRLSAYPLRVPPLREREGDVLMLAGHFVEENRRRMGLRGLRLGPSAQTALSAHAWPGNVRELEFLIARAALKAMHREASAKQGHCAIVTLDAEDLGLLLPAYATQPPTLTHALPATATTTDLRTAVDAFQRQYIEQTLQAHGGNRSATARALGLDRANLVRLCKRLGMALPARRN